MGEEQSLVKELILIIPASSHPLFRLALRFFFKTPTTFSLLILSALTPAEYKIKVITQKLIWLKSDFVPGALVGISCATSNSYEAYKIADRFRRAGSTVVLGGPHVSCFPDEALEHCDSLVIGEGESVWPSVIRDFENRSLKKIYRGQPLDDFFSPVYDYFLKVDPKILYRSGIMVSRGCKYHCEFCSQPLGGLRFIKLEQAVALIRRIKEKVREPFGWKPTIIFRDDNIFSSPAYAKRLFRELIPLNLSWIGNSSLDIAFDAEALSLARQSGCRGLFIGFETIYPQKLAKTSVKGISSTDDYLKAIRNIKAYGIKITGAFILGFDYYTHKDYLKLIAFLARARLYLISITILTPFPGSALYDRLKKEDRIINFDWRKYDSLQHVVFKPKNMSPFALAAWFLAVRAAALILSPGFLLPALWMISLYYLSYFLSFKLVGFLRGY
ncbi:MAG: radical SAM protein [Candidatus Omnitrophica bacterium]|nr:radical SAM protein [Candidatus Omnitrophota bacterium]